MADRVEVPDPVGAEVLPAEKNDVLVASDEDTESNGFSDHATKRLLRKVDRVLLPLLSLLYLLSFLDRTNIGNAKLAGLEKDLKMTGEYDYNTAVAIFYPFYVAAEIPSNMAMKRFRPSIWIPCLMLAWGLMTIMLGLVKNFAGLLAVRCALGLAEGGLFPGINYYITMWYKRHECGLRMAIFFSAATAAGAFGGLLARGIMEMDGIAGLHGWAWIFILEGIVTFLIAIVAYFFMQDYPATAKFLAPKERQEVLRRLEEDRHALSDELDVKFVKDAFKDWKIWVHMVITFGIFVGLYSVSIFLPTIIKNLDYTNEKAQLMSVPPYAVACVCTISGGFLADRFRKRGPFMIFFCLLAMTGAALLAGVENHKVKYFACFLVTSGIYANVPQGVAWNGNNMGGSFKRAVGLAMHAGCGNLGGIVAAFVYRARDAPQYRSGHLILLGVTSMSCALSIFMTLYLRKENARRDREYKAPSAYTREEMALEMDKGDNATFFRYTV